jgi:hypothetical protein
MMASSRGEGDDGTMNGHQRLQGALERAARGGDCHALLGLFASGGAPTVAALRASHADAVGIASAVEKVMFTHPCSFSMENQ